MLKSNRVCEILKIKYPILQGGMAGISEHKLVSAVSNAGGLGIIGAGLMPPEWLEKEIKLTKELSDKPFGVNLFMQNPRLKEQVKMVIKYQVPVVLTGGGNPLPLFPYLQAVGIKIIPVVPSPRLAKKMEEKGADAVVVEGLESGGHIGQNTTLSLVPQSKSLLQRIPLISAGGIYDGKSAKAVFILGAEGIQMGTRFLASKECQISEEYKEKIVTATADDISVVLRFTGHPLRVIKNKWAEEMLRLEERNPFPEEIKAEKIVSSLAKEDVENIPLMAGVCAGAIKEIKSCKEIIEEIGKEISSLS